MTSMEISILSIVAPIFILVLTSISFLIKYSRSLSKTWQVIPEEVLKVGGSKKRLEDFAKAGPIHFIVVGSGLGGLTVACLLSKVGYRVLVLEQHDVAGGATHTFTEQGFTFDVGVHYLGERLCSWWSPVRRLFDVASE